MAIDQKNLNRNDPAIDTDVEDGAQFDEDAPLPADKAQLELDRLHAAAENPFSPNTIPAAESEEERARQRREQGIETDADISTDGG